MTRVAEAQKILLALGLPTQQQGEMAGYTLLALGDVGRKTPWAEARRRSLGIHGVLEYMKASYRKTYAENTRETVRRHVLHQLVTARVVDLNPDEQGLATNSPRTHYALSEAALPVVRAFGTAAFEAEVERFRSAQPTLLALYQAKRATQLVPLTLASGETLALSPGRHNALQVEVLEKFGPCFAPGARLLYLGDTAKKHTVVETEALAELKIPVTRHDKLPDIVLHLPSRGWLFLIEAVTSHGPVSPKRKLELEEMLSACSLARVFVSAFPDFREFKKHVDNVAWETEVWIAEMPDHLVHFNGDKFLGPHA